MGYGMTIMLVIFMVNLLIFVGGLATGNPAVNSPMISLLTNVFSGSVNWTYLVTTIGSSAAWYLAIMALMTAAAVLTGANPLTGGGGYGATQVLTLITICIFLGLVAVPNFAVMGFPSMSDPTPYPIEEILYAVFGIMLTVGFIGVMRGE